MPVTQSEYRQTGVDFEVIDRHENDFLEITPNTTDINIPTAYGPAADPANTAQEYEQGWWGYRGQASCCVTPSTWQLALGFAQGGIQGNAVTSYTNRSAASADFTEPNLGAWDSNANTSGIAQQTTIAGASGNCIGRTFELTEAKPGIGISYVAGSSRAGTSAFWPAGIAVNDLAVVIAGGGSSAIVAPAGWTTFGDVAVGGSHTEVGFRRITADDVNGVTSGTGTWTNSNRVLVVIYRNACQLGITASSAVAATTTVTFPAQTGMIGSASIVRARIGDGTNTDYNVYKQELFTGNAGQETPWATWTLLYTATHYAVAVYLDYGPGVKSTITYVTAKSDGIYVNNVLKISVTNVIKIKPILFKPGHIFYCVVGQASDGQRKMDWWYTTDVKLPAGSGRDAANYDWYRSDLCGVYRLVSTNPTLQQIYMTRAIPESAPRSLASSMVMVSTYGNLDQYGYNVWANADYIKGPSGQSGFHSMENMFIYWDGPIDGFGTGYYYLIWNEKHTDIYGSAVSNLQNPVFWSKAYNQPYERWSVPTPPGFTIWGLAGYVKLGIWWYILGNGRVFQRPDTATIDDLSNYVIEGNYELPRNSEPGTGQLTVANPNNVVGNILGLVSSAAAGETEREVQLRIGLKRVGEAAWTWKQDDIWFISGLAKTNENNKDRITIELGNFGHLASLPFREVISIPGRISWRDWSTDGVNDQTLWASTDEFDRTAKSGGQGYDLKIQGGDTFFAAWRGENAYCQFSIDQPSTRLFFRYKDTSNYYFIEFSNTYRRFRFGVVDDGKQTIIYTINNFQVNPTQYVEIDFRWNNIRVLYYGDEIMVYPLSDPIQGPGFVGVQPLDGYAPFKITGFTMNEWNKKITTGQLIGKLLSYLNPRIPWTITVNEDTLAEQVNILWGPQSDLDTPGKALQQLLENSKLEIIYDPALGSYVVDHFDTDIDSVTVSIGNSVITHDQVNKSADRPNIVVVDGQRDSWDQYDKADLGLRQRPVVKYLDLPDLDTPGDVKSRAEKEVRDANRFTSPGGDVVWSPDYTRMEPVFWTDADNNQFLTRIEGLSVSFDQSLVPFQRVRIDTGTFIYCPPSALPATYLARDVFQRSVTSGWTNAQIGGTWTIS